MWAIGVLVVALVQCAYALRLPGFGTQPKPSAVSSNDPSPSTLISVARDFVTGGFGVVDPTLLSDKSFACSGQLFSLNDKKRYVSALSKETSAFRRAMPDFEFRPYDFEIDPENKNTVWFKIRPRGTITGPFTYKTDVYLPNKKAIELPLQLCSVSIDETNKVSRVTAGYVIDRFTGNTGGYPGPFGVLYALGYAPNPLQFLPPAAVLRRVFARTRKPENLRVGSSPFPESVMLGLAKALLDSSLGAADPSLLSDSFTFSGPIVGPLPKKEFVRAFSSFNLKTALPNLSPGPCSLRVDAYEPDRVWIIARGSGTMTGPLSINGRTLAEPTNRQYNGPPEAVSVSFDAQGRCYKATAGYVIDREQGNTNGLGGVFGILEAIGSPLPWWETRSFPELVRDVTASVFKPKAGAGAGASAASAAGADAGAGAAVKALPPAVVRSSVKGTFSSSSAAAAAAPAAKAAGSSAPGFFSFLQQAPSKPSSTSSIASSSTGSSSSSASSTASSSKVEARPVVKPAAKPVAAKPVVSAAPKAVPRPTAPSAARAPTANKAAPGPTKAAPSAAPKTAPKTAPAVAAPAPAPAAGGFFSFLSPAPNAPEAASKEPAKVPAKAAPVATKTAAPAAPKTAPAAAAPAPGPAAGGFFSFLSPAPNAPEAPSKEPAKVPTKSAPVPTKAAAPTAKGNTQGPAVAKGQGPAIAKASAPVASSARPEEDKRRAAAAAAAATAAAKKQREEDAQGEQRRQAELKQKAEEDKKRAAAQAAAATEAKKKAPSPAPAPAPAPGLFGRTVAKPSPASASAAAPRTTALSPAASKALSQRGASAQAVAACDASLGGYLAGKVGPETIFADVKRAVGRDAAFEAFPDIIGSLPRGEQKTRLNNWYQQQAV